MVESLRLYQSSASPQSIGTYLADLDAELAVSRFAPEGKIAPLKTTVSLCPKCLAYVPALVFTRDGKVFMRKLCDADGPSEALIESDQNYYFLSNKDRSGRRFADDRIMEIPELDGGCCSGNSCGTDKKTNQSANRTCTVLVEVTDACNMECPVCYSDSNGERFLPFDTFKTFIRKLIDDKGALDSVQVTGGESTLHPRFWDMVEFLYNEPGVKKIYVPTNGILFAQAENANRAAKYADKLMVLLQFDAVSKTPNRTLRAAHPDEIRRRVVQHMSRLGVHMQLTMTLSSRVNEHEVGEVIDLGLDNSCIKVIALQPVTWSGRHDVDRDPLDRLTLSDVAKAVHAHAQLRMKPGDFIPIPCSHPNCGWITLFVRRFGLLHNVSRYVDLPQVMNTVAYKTLLSTDELRDVVRTQPSILGRIAGAIGQKLVRSTDIFTVAIKPFMDRYSYDQDRIANCCHHLTTTDGDLVSFCEYNALLRPKDSWAKFPRLSDM
jgi:7,8-dihydro-6-hydroxymethylpterin dimethyltransferase